MKKFILILLVTISFSNIYSQEISFFVDSRDENQYQTVKIGETTWMAENLKFKTSKGKFWAYDYNNDYVEIYGYLYDWEAANNACPAGWELPKKKDFDALLDSLGGEDANAYYSLIPGGNSGFSATYGGWRGYYGYFSFIDEMGYFWSGTQNGSLKAWNLVVSTYESALVFNNFKTMGFSVRCIKKD